MPIYSDGRDAVALPKRAAMYAENRRLRGQVAALTERLAALQKANEAADRTAYDARQEADALLRYAAPNAIRLLGAETTSNGPGRRNALRTLKRGA